MKNWRTNWSLASLDAIEELRDFSDVSLAQYAAEPHTTWTQLGEEGEGEGEVSFLLLTCTVFRGKRHYFI